MLVAGPLVACRDIQDSVSIYKEYHLDPGYTGRLGCDRSELEARQASTILRQLPLTLQDVHIHVRLIVDSGGKTFGRAGRDGGIAMDQALHHSPHRLDPKG